MKGGLMIIFGVVFVFLAVLLMMFVFICNAPDVQNAPLCQPIKPVLDIISPLVGS